MKILIIEDDNRIAHNISSLLKEEQFITHIEHSYENGMYSATQEQYDLIIVDWMLPDIDGVDLVKELRRLHYKTPCLMLTAKSQTEDIVSGFEAGVDDYVTKPFSKEVLLARIKALLRRKEIPLISPRLVCGALQIDTEKRVVFYGTDTIHLAPKEYMLLEYLVFHQGKSIDRMELLEQVWGESIDELSNTVDVHIRYLRKKIDEVYHVKLIQTIKNKGYMLCQI